jgi:hypothetical protein
MSGRSTDRDRLTDSKGGIMQIEINSSTLTLSPANLLTVRNGTGTRILCRSGCLWVTQEGDIKDSVVAAGEVLTIRRPGRTLISALEPSSLTLTGPDTRDVSAQRQMVRAPRLVAESVACG